MIEREDKPAEVVDGKLVFTIGKHAIETFRLKFD
jgi:hypothetical protein